MFLHRERELKRSECISVYKHNIPLDIETTDIPINAFIFPVHLQHLCQASVLEGHSAC